MEFRINRAFRTRRTRGERQGRRRVMSSADVERGQSMDHLYVKPISRSEQKRTPSRRDGHRQGDDSARRHSRSRRHSHETQHLSRKDFITRGYPSESNGRSHSTSGVRAHGVKQPSSQDGISLDYPYDHQPPRQGASRETWTGSDRRTQRQVSLPPPYHVNSVHRP